MKNNGKLLMLFFVASESFFFVALLIAYVYYRNFTEVTDTVAAHLDPGSTGFYTLFLLASSGTAILAERWAARDRWFLARLGLAATIALATVFLYGQLTEFARLYALQITLKTDVFGSSFFTLTGFHAAHVILGVVALLVTLGLSLGHKRGNRRVAASGLGGVSVYWHFVDVVWVVLFSVVYLIPTL